MATYKAPLRDMRFVLYELHRGDELTQLPGFEEITPDLIDPVLEEAAKVCEEILFPLNRSGDEEGLSYLSRFSYAPIRNKTAHPE